MTQRNVARPLSSATARLWRDERGVSAVMMAISLTVVIGFGALGAETGMWYAIKRQNQSAADAAAISAAYEVMAGNTSVSTYLTPAATRAATQNGYNGAAPVVTYPYTDAIVSNAVAVTLLQTQGALLSSLFLNNVTIETKAVARVFPAAPGCILTLGTTGTNVEVSGSSTLSAPDCSVMAASTSNCAINDHDQGGTITAKYLITAGQISYGQGCNVFDPTNPPSNLHANLMAGVASSQFTDPYTGTGGYLSHSFLTCNPSTNSSISTMTTCAAGTLTTASGVKTVTYPGNCKVTSARLNSDNHSNHLGNNDIIKLSANTQISGDLSVQGVTVNLSPGTYWITDGDLAFGSNGTLECTLCSPATGAGVTIIFTTTSTSGTIKIGAPTMQSNPTIDSLNARTSGTYAGLLMVQDTVSGATYTTTAKFQGNPGQTLNGLIYTPNSNLEFQGNPSVTNSCLLVVANSMTLDGNSSLATGGCPSTLPLPTVKSVALAS
jgi:Flp pilus assembly protein TadG